MFTCFEDFFQINFNQSFFFVVFRSSPSEQSELHSWPNRCVMPSTGMDTKLVSSRTFSPRLRSFPQRTTINAHDDSQWSIISFDEWKINKFLVFFYPLDSIVFDGNLRRPKNHVNKRQRQNGERNWNTNLDHTGCHPNSYHKCIAMHCRCSNRVCIRDKPCIHCIMDLSSLVGIWNTHTKDLN